MDNDERDKKISNADYCVNVTSNNKLAPILSNSIVDCIKFHKSQYIISNPISFTISSNNNIYSDNSKICITNIRYSYDYIALPSTIPFYLCNNECDFYGIRNEYFYEKYSIPLELQEEIANSINEANLVIDAAGHIRSITDIDEKFQASIDVAILLGSSIMNAAETIKNLTEFQYPTPISGSLEDILTNIIYSIMYVVQANYLFSTLLNGLTVPTIENIALDIYNSSSENDSAVDYIIIAAELIENYPNAPAEALNFANLAKNTANDLKNKTADILSSPGTQSFESIRILISESIFAVSYVYNGFGILVNNFGTDQLREYLRSINNLLNALSYSVFSVRKIELAKSLPQDKQIEALNSVVDDIIKSANFVIAALDFENNLEKIYLYNTWESIFSSGQCNNCCKYNNINDSTNSKALFYEKLNSFKISNLSIEIYGTIGNKEFTAISNNKGIVELTDLGLESINIKSKISVPSNSSFSLIQNINSNLVIDCISPTRNYDISNPDNIFAKLDYYFNVNNEILVNVRKALVCVAYTDEDN